MSKVANKTVNKAANKVSKAKRQHVAISLVPAAEPVGNYNAETHTFMPSADMQPTVAVTAPTTVKPVRVTKKRVIYDLLTTGKFKAEELGEIMGISTIAAKSLIGDLRRDGTEVTSSFENKIWFYTVVNK